MSAAGPTLDGGRFLGMAAVTRSRPEPRSARRNLLSDFDALIERTMVASSEGRDPTPFLDDAVRLARTLAGPCLSDDPDHITRAITLMSADKMAKYKDSVEERVRGGIASAISCLDALDTKKSERHAATVKYFVRSVACQCTRPGFAWSGHAVW
jgi:hypothetical protein